MNTMLPLCLHRRMLLLAAIIALVCTAALRAQGSEPAIYVGDLNFGTFVIGADGPKTIPLQVCNIGGGELRFTKPGDLDPTHLLEWLQGRYFTVDPAEIARLKDTILGRNQCVTLHVTFTPAKVGVFQVTGRFWGSTRDRRDTSVWTAMAVKPGPQLGSYDWGAHWLVPGDGNCTKDSIRFYGANIHLGNTGTANVRVKRIDIVGGTPGAFRLDSSSRATTIMVGDEVRPGDQLAQRVLFLPTDEIVYGSTLRVISEPGDTVYGNLIGVGVESHGHIQGVTFDTIPSPDGPEQRKTARLTVFPTRTLSITNLSIIGPDADAFGIDPSALAVLPYERAPGANVDIRVSYTPRHYGLHQAWIVFTGDHSRCDDSTGLLTAFVGVPSGVDDGAGSGGYRLERDGMMGSAVALRYHLPVTAEVRIDVFDALGRPAALLVSGREDAGEHRATWNAAGAPAGVYFCRMSAPGWTATVPVIVR